MEKDEYENMFNLEDFYWWFKGLRNLVFSSIKKFSGRGRIKLLDAGCGTGKFLESCKAYEAYGIDVSEEAIRFCRHRNMTNFKKASITDIPFDSNSFDVVTSMDVLSQRGINNDLTALKEFYRVLNNNGTLILNLPAFKFLRSTHDEVVHIRQRYDRIELNKKLDDVGFKIEIITYRNTILFPLILLKRFAGKYFREKGEKVQSDLRPPPMLINSILTYILFLENKLIDLGRNFPFGCSLYCIARKEITNV